jgi:copper chaperone
MYSVPAISCGHCKSAIEAEVATVSGVDQVEVDIEARSVRVEGDATDDAIRAAIVESGYEVATAP